MAMRIPQPLFHTGHWPAEDPNLPVAERWPAEALSESFDRTASARVSRTHALTVLVVDDDSQMRTLLKVQLDQLGYRVEAVGTRAEALAQLALQGFPLVISDYELPDGTGLQLLEAIQQQSGDAPAFILLSGSLDVELPLRSLAQGAVEFLPKPVSLTDLAGTIQRTWVRVERERLQAAALANEALAGAIKALVAAVDAKDPHTARHSQRVTQVAVLLGRQLGLGRDELQLLEFAALVHDVGKIGVPDEILQKPGRLDEEEWQIIRQHPIRSAEIVSQMGPMARLAPIVRHHHERVDGKGYPDGLVGDAIPFLSRIIAVADVYEALTADRSYRRAWTESDARRIISEGLGTHFDRVIGETFLSLEMLPAP